MIPGVFVTATGTDVGKTMCVAGLLRQLLTAGVDCMVMKPVQTGAIRDRHGRWIAPDIEYVCGAAGLSINAQTLDHVAPYLYQPACSPHLAARLAGQTIAIDRIGEHARWLAARHAFLVVEGAGGLMVPLNEQETMLDLIVALDMPAILVGHSQLGTINHVQLSIEAMRHRGVKILGVILNDTRPVSAGEQYICDDNVRTIQAYGKIPVLARVGYLGCPPDLNRLDACLAGLSPKLIGVRLS